MHKNKVIAYLHTHWDHEWYKTGSEFNVRLVEVFDGILYCIKKNLIPCFYMDGQVLSLLNYLKFRPEKKEIIKKFIKQKKLFIGPFYVSADSFIPCAASLCKNLEYGMEISKKFAQKEFIGYLCDTFGHSRSIFEILKKFNIQNSIVWRGAGNLPSDFTFNGVKTIRLPQGYYHTIQENLEETLDKIKEYSNNLILLPLGGDHLGVTHKIKDILSKIHKYDIELKSPFEYIKKTDFSLTNLKGEFLDNSNSYILGGVRTIRTKEKARNAQLEWNLFNKAGVFNRFMGGKYNSELKFCELELIKNHAHDSIYGCSIDEVNQAVKCRQTTVDTAANAIIKNLIRDFNKKYLIEKTEKFAGVFNFSPCAFDGTAKLICDKKIKNAQKIRQYITADDEILTDINKNPMTEDFHIFYEYIIETGKIPPFAFKNIKLKKPAKSQIAGPDFIENSKLKLFVCGNKIYAVNKLTDELYADFIRLISTKDCGDSYNCAPCEKPRIIKLKSCKMKVNGIIQSVLQLKFEQNIILNVKLNNKSEFFEIEAVFTNKTKNRNLQIVFNTQKPVEKTLSGNPAGAIERLHDYNYSLFDSIPVKDKSELKTNSFPFQKFVCANNVMIFAKGLYDYEVYENDVRISLLRSTGIISNPKNPARGVPAGPPIECPDMQCVNEHFEFHLGAGFYNSAVTIQKLKGLSDVLFEPACSISGAFKIKNKTMLKNPACGEFGGISLKTGKALFL